MMTRRWTCIKLVLNCRAKKMYEILNKQVKFTQHIGTCKSAYTKGYDLN